jgi:hypothetical protein
VAAIGGVLVLLAIILAVALYLHFHKPAAKSWEKY